MDETKMMRNIKSAGVWFVGEYGGLILENYERLSCDKDFKAAFIEKIFKESKRDSSIGGTKTRVYSVIYIIDRGELKEALDYVIHANNVRKSDLGSIEKARKTLKELL